MLTQYKNIEQINSATKAVTAQRITKSKTEFFSYDKDTRVIPVPVLSKPTENVKVEMHVYVDDTWITGNHQVQLLNKLPNYQNTNSKQEIK